MHVKVVYLVGQLLIQILYVVGEYYKQTKSNDISNARVLLDVVAPSTIACAIKCSLKHADTLYKNGRCRCFQVFKEDVAKPVISGTSYRKVKMPVNSEVLYTLI